MNNEKERKGSKEQAVSRTKILIIDDQPEAVTPLQNFLKQNSMFASVDSFTVGQLTNDDTNLEGGYKQLRQRVEDSLKNGDNLIILADYSFDTSDLEHAKNNGATWTFNLLKDFPEQAHNSQFAVYGHGKNMMTSVKSLFMDFGAKGIIDKQIDPKETLRILESGAVKARIKYLLHTDNPLVLALLTTDIIAQLLPNSDDKSRLVRHNLNGLLGAEEIHAIRGKQVDLQEIKQILSLIEEFSGILDLEEGFSFRDIFNKSNFIDPLFMKFNTESKVDLQRNLNNDLVQFLFNLISVFESNMMDIIRDGLNLYGFYSGGIYIFPYLFIKDNQLVIGFANNGPIMDEGIFNKLGQINTSSKGEGRGVGLASAARIAGKMGIGLSAMQLGHGKVDVHDLVSQENISSDYFNDINPSYLSKARTILLEGLSSFCSGHIQKYLSIPMISFLVTIPLEQVHRK